MSEKWSPSPWRVSDDHRTRRIIKAANGSSVVIVESWTTEPDAHLIAAAPTLAHALKEAEALLSLLIKEAGGCDHSVGICMCSDYTTLDVVRDALALARGEAPRATEGVESDNERARRQV